MFLALTLLGSIVFIMSLLTHPLAGDAVERAIGTMSSELVFLLESTQVPRDIIAKLGELGYTDMDTFSNMEVNPKEVRTVLKDDVGLDPAGGAGHRAMTARIIGAWASAGHRTTKQREEDATQRATDLPRHLPKSKHLELTRAYTAAHRELRDRERPAPAYLDWRFEQVEDGELKAESLSEVLNKEEANDDEWGGARVNPDGTIRLLRARSTGKTPDCPEGLRDKVKLMGVAWEYVRLRFPSKPYLAELVAQDWTDHVEWLLGEDVYGYVVKDSAQTISYRPSWATLVELDYRVRRKAYSLVNDAGSTLKKALVTARSDTALFQRYFLTPVSLAAGAEAARASQKRAAPQESQHRQVPPAQRPQEGSWGEPATFVQNPSFDQRSKGKGRGKKGTKGDKGKGKRPNKGPQVEATQPPTLPPPAPATGSWRKGQSSTTPDGRAVCFAYNRNRCNGNCGMVHVCLVCGGGHPKSACPRRPAQGDAAGHPKFQ